MNGEAFIGFNTFNSQKITGKREMDYLAYRRGLAAAKTFDDDFCEEVIPKPQK